MIRCSDMNEIEGLIRYSTLVIQVTFGLFIFSVISIYLSGRWGAPWIVTTPYIISRMLELGKLKQGDCIVDLGAGDGRVLIYAARDYMAEGFGVEIDPIRVLLARFFIWRNRVHRKVKVHWGNLFETKLHNVDVITLYLTRETNQRLRPLLEERCDQGTRVVSYAFPVSGWSPVVIDDMNLIFVYEVGKTGDDVIVQFV
jgi:SAM-dependent methyltransferase